MNQVPVAVAQHPTVDASYIREEMATLQVQMKQYQEAYLRCDGALAVLHQLLQKAEADVIAKAKAQLQDAAAKAELENPAKTYQAEPDVLAPKKK